jgi:hypothetical protein
VECSQANSFIFQDVRYFIPGSLVGVKIDSADSLVGGKTCGKKVRIGRMAMCSVSSLRRVWNQMSEQRSAGLPCCTYRRAGPFARSSLRGSRGAGLPLVCGNSERGRCGSKRWR